MIGMIARFCGVPGWLVVAIGVVLLVLGGLGGKCAYDNSVIRDHQQGQQVKQMRREEGADATLGDARERDARASETRKKEMNDALRNLPDRGLSDRQRRILCVELRRQRSPDADAACGPALPHP